MKLPITFNELAALMPPSGILNDRQCVKFTGMIDRLMCISELTLGQELYMLKLAQLVEVYGAKKPI